MFSLLGVLILFVFAWFAVSWDRDDTAGATDDSRQTRGRAMIWLTVCVTLLLLVYLLVALLRPEKF
jgi:K+-transporting ATPase KdpF subunit